MSAVVFVETVRRHVTSAGYLTFLALIAMLGMFVATFNVPGSGWPSMVTMLAIITGSALIGPEFSEGSLQLIVSKPIARHAYVLGRAAGVFASVGLAAFTAFLAEVVTRTIVGTAVPPRLVEILAGELVVALLAIAFLAMLGSVTTWYFNAAIYIGAQAALMIVETVLGAMRLRSEFIDAHPEIAQITIAIDDALFPSVPPHLTAAWTARCLGLTVVALVLACLAFQRREVPYGAD